MNGIYARGCERMGGGRVAWVYAVRKYPIRDSVALSAINIYYNRKRGDFTATFSGHTPRFFYGFRRIR